MNKYVSPAYRSRSFHCPHCEVFAEQHWGVLNYREVLLGQGKKAYIEGIEAEYSICQHCKQPALWARPSLVYPTIGRFPSPNDDLPEEVKRVYVEAGSIAQLSPRAACALLRLALEMLLTRLGESGDIGRAIENITKKNLDPEIKNALHIVRVIGNHAIHAGKIDFGDDTDTIGLFELLNAIAYDRITKPRERAEMYKRLPKADRDFIAKKEKKIEGHE